MLHKWYVIQVMSSKEEDIVKKCQTLLPKNTYIECFIPKRKQFKKFRGVWQEVEEILFKGYVFIISDTIEDVFTELKKIPDFTKLLGNDGEYIYPLLPHEASFLTSFSSLDHVIDVSIGVIEHDKIIIMQGPLQGKEAIIKKIDRHKRIALVEVSLLGELRLIQVGLEIVSKI